MWNDSEKMIEIYNKLNEEKIEFPCECPNCKSKTAHIYFHKHNDMRCGVWVWCSECRAFAHMSSSVPNWWENPTFIDENELCAEPNYLDAKATLIDEWVNSLVPSKTTKTQLDFIEDRFNAKLKIDIQGIPSGTEGVLVVKNNFKIATVQFICKSGKIVDLLLSYEELLKAIEIV